MANFKHLSLIFTILVVATISMRIGHCRVFHPNDAKLIEDTCNKTVHPSLCLQILKADDRSSSADVKGLALIMFDAIKYKANDTLNKIHKLLQDGGETETSALHSCNSRYKTILEADVPQAEQGLKFGNPKFAEEAASDSSLEAISCEEAFARQFPLIHDNTDMRDVADVTTDIVRLLL